MFNVNIVKAFKREFIRIWEVVLTGSLASGAGVMAISLGVVTTSLIGLQLPIFLITFIRAFGDTAVGFIPNTLVGRWRSKYCSICYDFRCRISFSL